MSLGVRACALWGIIVVTWLVPKLSSCRCNPGCKVSSLPPSVSVQALSQIFPVSHHSDSLRVLYWHTHRLVGPAKHFRPTNSEERSLSELTLILLGRFGVNVIHLSLRFFLTAVQEMSRLLIWPLSQMWGHLVEGFLLLATVFSEDGLGPALDFPRLSPYSISVHRVLSLEVLTEGGLVLLPQPSVPGRAGRQGMAQLLKSPFKFSLAFSVLISEFPFLRIALAIPSPSWSSPLSWVWPGIGLSWKEIKRCPLQMNQNSALQGSTIIF